MCYFSSLCVCQSTPHQTTCCFCQNTPHQIIPDYNYKRSWSPSERAIIKWPTLDEVLKVWKSSCNIQYVWWKLWKPLISYRGLSCVQVVILEINFLIMGCDFQQIMQNTKKIMQEECISLQLDCTKTDLIVCSKTCGWSQDKCVRQDPGTLETLN